MQASCSLRIIKDQEALRKLTFSHITPSWDAPFAQGTSQIWGHSPGSAGVSPAACVADQRHSSIPHLFGLHPGIISQLTGGQVAITIPKSDRITLQTVLQSDMAISKIDFDPQPVTLTGNLVRLEPLELAHAADLYAVGAEDSIWRYAARPALGSVVDAEGWIKACLEESAAGTRVTFAVIHLETGKAVGSTAYIDIVREHRTLEIGMTWYGTAWQRTGVNTECKYLLLRHAFEELSARRVSLKSDSRNERSRRAILRLGAVEEGTLRNHRIARDGVDRHTVYYSVIESEWPAVKGRLEGLMRR